MWEQFGESQKLRLVRILRSTVMVRVGGGWVSLDEFLVKNDPCRGWYSFWSHFIELLVIPTFVSNICRIFCDLINNCFNHLICDSNELHFVFA